MSITPLQRKILFSFFSLLIFSIHVIAQVPELWGLGSSGGSDDNGDIFKIKADGSAFEVMHNFDVYAEGASPFGSLVQTASGKLYGMTAYGGAIDNGYGIIFEYDPVAEIYAKKYDFDFTNGAFPTGNLIQISNGKLYGMAYQGGLIGSGVIFEYDPVA